MIAWHARPDGPGNTGQLTLLKGPWMSQKWEDHWETSGRLRNAHPAYNAAILRDAVRDEPEAAVFWLLLGHELTSLRRIDEAEKALKRCLALTPPAQQRDVFSAFGHLADVAGNLALAEQWYRRAIEADPDDASGHIYLGALYAGMCRLKDAENAHAKATKCSKGCVDEAYYNLGLVLRAQGRLGESKKCFDKAIELDPDYEDALIDLFGRREGAGVSRGRAWATLAYGRARRGQRR